MDVKTAFLHGDLKEEIYIEQPEGFEVKGKENLVCRLKKSLYGLKQAPRQWYEKFDSFMVGHEYKRTAADQCVYVRKFPDGNFIILLLYVDDMLIVGQDATAIKSLKKELSQSFDMKDLGPAQQMLGIQIVRGRKAKKLWLSQEKYIERVIAKFNMKDSKPVNTPLANHFKLSKSSCSSSTKEREEMEAIPYSFAVESLMYAMVSTRPDIAHAVGAVSRFLSNPGKEHWEAVKWILRYLKGTAKMCLCFRSAKPVLEGYTDSDMAGDLDGRKSTSGFLFTFAGGAVSWQSKLQNYVALSTTEAEYITAAEAVKEMLWLQRFLQELGLKQEKFMVHCDSQSAIDLSKNSMYHSRTKHINIRYHWILYRGKLTDGGEIAVKKPLVISKKGKELVLNEMKLLLGSAHHRNIEFASNGSLDYLLFNSETCRADTLDWKRTYAIIIGVARGLLYLHERSHNVIIHCDIKRTNILIDENWVPKIANFGTANLFPQDQTHVNISEATVGYLALEYIDNGHVSPKADTYSFGVVVLELISGWKNWNSHNQSPNGQGLQDRANELCKEVKVSEFMDLKLIPSAVLDQVQLCVKIGVLCIEFDLELRPTMDRACSMLLENHSSSSTLVNEPMRDGSSSSSSTARNSEIQKFRSSDLNSNPSITHISSSNRVYPEGTHLMIPWFERPIVYDVRARPNLVESSSGSHDLQMVKIALRVLTRPVLGQLPTIYRTLGENYNERVLPSIVHETLKVVVAQYNASQLITQREVFPCVSATCGRFYHPHCVAKLLHHGSAAEAEELQKKIAAGESFTCPIHKCSVCKLGENKMDPDLQFAVSVDACFTLIKKIAFEDDEDQGIVQRAWEEHLIDDELCTPDRNHIKFPDDGQQKKKQASRQLSSKVKVLQKERSLASQDAPRKRTLEKVQKGVDLSLKIKEETKSGRYIQKAFEQHYYNKVGKSTTNANRASLGERLYALINKDSRNEDTSDSEHKQTLPDKRVGKEMSSSVPLDDDRKRSVQGITFELDEEMLSEGYLTLARDIEVMEPKSPKDIYKVHLLDGRASAGASVDSARQNLAATFVNAFVNVGFGQDKLMTVPLEALSGGSSGNWLFKNKEHGKVSAAASLGMILLWDVDSGLAQLDKYFHSNDNHVIADALLGVGIVNCGIKNDRDPVNKEDSSVRIGAIMGLGLAYAGAQNEQIRSKLTPILGDNKIEPDEGPVRATIQEVAVAVAVAAAKEEEDEEGIPIPMITKEDPIETMWKLCPRKTSARQPREKTPLPPPRMTKQTKEAAKKVAKQQQTIEEEVDEKSPTTLNDTEEQPVNSTPEDSERLAANDAKEDFCPQDAIFTNNWEGILRKVGWQRTLFSSPKSHSLALLSSSCPLLKKLLTTVTMVEGVLQTPMDSKRLGIEPPYSKALGVDDDEKRATKPPSQSHLLLLLLLLLLCLLRLRKSILRRQLPATPIGPPTDCR
ncbi:unnamed protein product [Camellia sinensis]